MNLSSDEKTKLYAQLDEFFSKHVKDDKSKFDSVVFRSLYSQFLEENPFIDWDSWKFISEDVQRNYGDLPKYTEDRKILDRLVVVKLNGGLGTTMGCEGPKSFVKVKGELSFLDVALKQHQIFNDRHSSEVPLYLMNSFYTDSQTKPVLPAWVKTFNQSRCPRIYTDTLLPVDETGTDEEWYPPGHGNIFESLNNSGVLQELIDQGRDIMFVSNIDNTGATLDLQIAKFFAEKEADYVMECTLKTQNDIKGGTLIDIAGQLMHLEMPQVPPEHLDEFCSTRTFKIFNTNNIWVSLRAVQQRLSTLRSEIIVNKKVLNGRGVIQLETSIGGCIRNFPKAYCIHVDRHRFLPVKKSDDLLAISSSLYVTSPEDGSLRLARTSPAPIVSLGSYFQKVDDFHARLPFYPEMRELNSLAVEGDVTFGENITLMGDVKIINKTDAQVKIPNDSVFDNETKVFE